MDLTFVTSVLSLLSLFNLRLKIDMFYKFCTFTYTHISHNNSRAAEEEVELEVEKRKMDFGL